MHGSFVVDGWLRRARGGLQRNRSARVEVYRIEPLDPWRGTGGGAREAMLSMSQENLPATAMRCGRRPTRMMA
jgi:hypothetical protein